MTSWTVEPEAAGERLDRHVAARLDVPRNQVQHWIAGGLVRVNGGGAKPSALIAAGDRVECSPPAPKEERIVPEPGALTVLHEDVELGGDVAVEPLSRRLGIDDPCCKPPLSR